MVGSTKPAIAIIWIDKLLLACYINGADTITKIR